jgi:hypothetical protein
MAGFIGHNRPNRAKFSVIPSWMASDRAKPAVVWLTHPLREAAAALPGSAPKPAKQPDLSPLPIEIVLISQSIISTAWERRPIGAHFTKTARNTSFPLRKYVAVRIAKVDSFVFHRDRHRSEAKPAPSRDHQQQEPTAGPESHNDRGSDEARHHVPQNLGFATGYNTGAVLQAGFKPVTPPPLRWRIRLRSRDFFALRLHKRSEAFRKAGTASMNARSRVNRSHLYPGIQAYFNFESPRRRAFNGRKDDFGQCDTQGCRLQQRKWQR